MKYPKRLIEVDLSIRRISAYTRRETRFGMCMLFCYTSMGDIGRWPVAGLGRAH